MKLLKFAFFVSWLLIWILATAPILLTYIVLGPNFVYCWVKNTMTSVINRYIIWISNCYLGRKIYYYGDNLEETRGKNSILILNHSSSIDLIIAAILTERIGCSGYIRYFTKTFNMLVPIAGFVFTVLGFVSLSRNNRTQDIKRIKQSVINQLKLNEPIMYILFPEGTRFNPNNKDVITKSNQFLDQKFGKHTRYVISPRITGLKTIIESMDHNLDEILDVTICYSGKITPPGEIPSVSLFDYMWNDAIDVHLYIKRWNWEEIKKLNTDCSYLYDWFYKKDKIIEQFHNNHRVGLFKHLNYQVIHNRDHIWAAISVPVVYITLIYIMGYKIIICLLVFLSIISYTLQLYKIVIEPNISSKA